MKHISRTSCLIFVIDASDENYLEAFDTLLQELKTFSEPLAEKQRIILCNKIDVEGAYERAEEIKAKLQEQNPSEKVLFMSVYERKGLKNVCDLEEYINEDLVDKVALSHYNSAVSGTLTGLGILGTFLGLSMGLGSFDGNNIYTISDNVGPLLDGMKVAFHTSVYGIFFSIIFNFIYRGIMSDAYEKLEEFQNAFRQYAMPVAATEDENSAAMVIYQAGMVNSMKQMVELLKALQTI